MINIKLNSGHQVEGALDGNQVRVFDAFGRQIGSYPAYRRPRTTDDDAPSAIEADHGEIVKVTVLANEADLLPLVDILPQ